MPLPLPYVERIHQRLTVRYGSAWVSKWAGVDQAAIQADWAEQLDGMQPENIRKALGSLPPEFPPTATAFRALGLINDEHKPAALLPPPDQAGMKRIGESLQAGRTELPTPSEWMQQLRRDVESGNASRARKDHYRIAVANGYYGGATVEQLGDFRPILRERWPESMQAEPVAHARAFATPNPENA